MLNFGRPIVKDTPNHGGRPNGQSDTAHGVASCAQAGTHLILWHGLHNCSSYGESYCSCRWGWGGTHLILWRIRSGSGAAKCASSRCEMTSRPIDPPSTASAQRVASCQLTVAVAFSTGIAAVRLHVSARTHTRKTWLYVSGVLHRGLQL